LEWYESEGGREGRREEGKEGERGENCVKINEGRRESGKKNMSEKNDSTSDNIKNRPKEPTPP